MRKSRLQSPEFYEDLTSSYARKRFFRVIGLIIVVGLFIILLLSPGKWGETVLYRNVAVSLLSDVLAMCIIVFVFYIVYVYFIGENTAHRDMSAIRPQDINECWKQLSTEATEYMYWGRTGRNFRAVSLKNLDAYSKEKHRSIVVRVLLPDPRYPDLDRSFADLLESNDSSGNREGLLSQVLATCLVCAIVASKNPLLKIDLHLSKFFPGFRLDASSNGALLTQDDLRKYALYFEYNSEFYNMLHTTIVNECAISRRIEWSPEEFRALSLAGEICSENILSRFKVFETISGEVQQEVEALIRTTSESW